MSYGTLPPLARQLEHGRFNRFLASLPPHDFSLLSPHLRTILRDGKSQTFAVALGEMGNQQRAKADTGQQDW